MGYATRDTSDQGFRARVPGSKWNRRKNGRYWLKGFKRYELASTYSKRRAARRDRHDARRDDLQ